MKPRIRPAVGRVGAATTVVLLLLSLVTPAAAADLVTVTITDTLDPAAVTTTPGTTIVWVNQDSERHRIASVSGPEQFDSGNLDPGEQFSVVLNLEGSYDYLDDRNDDDSAYFGTITVTADVPPPGDPGDPPPPPPPSDANVRIINRLYQPRNLEVATGAIVTWLNDDDRAHTVTATDRSWDSGIFDTGGNYQRVFNSAGAFEYFCTLHPDMVGTITVVGVGDEPPPPPPPPEPPPPPPTPPPPGTGDITIIDFDYTPQSITVVPGSTVSWVNAGTAPHTVTDVAGSFDSGFLMTSDLFERTFTTAGTYSYFCTIHPEMVGTVVVSGDGGELPPGDPPPDPDPPVEPVDPPPSPPPPSASGVNIIDNAFDPTTRTVTTGTTVTWNNAGALPHTVTARDGAFDSGFMMSGDTYRRTFTQPGTFDYFCTLHPEMAAKIVVTGEPTAPPDEVPPGQEPPAESSPQVPSGPSSVAVVDNAYDPMTISVAAGTTVTWSNVGQLPHTVTASNGAFDSGFMMTGDAYRLTFNSPGSIDYFCTIHPEMTGTIVVTEAAIEGDRPSVEETMDGAASGSPGVDSSVTAESGASAEAEPLVVKGVRMIDNDFDPSALTVEVGATVRWSNAGNLPHTVTAQDGAFDSGFVEPGGAFLRRFDAVGTYDYLCTLHPGMEGTIDVVAPVAAAPGREAGLSSAVPSEPNSPLIAFILAGGMLAVMIVFTVGMARFGKAAAQQH